VRYADAYGATGWLTRSAASPVSKRTGIGSVSAVGISSLSGFQSRSMVFFNHQTSKGRETIFLIHPPVAQLEPGFRRVNESVGEQFLENMIVWFTPT